MIIFVGSQKGGCGKSTIAVHISAELANQGLDVVLLDADRQPTCANWAVERAENKTLKPVHWFQKYEDIRGTLIDLKSRYDYVVVDAAGKDSRELRTGILAADILIVPFKASQADLDTLPKMQEMIVIAKDYNPKLKVFSVLSAAPTHPLNNEISEARECIADYPELPLVRTMIYDRKIYRASMSDGLGVVETKNAKAKAEIQLLINEVLIND